MFLALVLVLPPLLATSLACLLVATLFRRPIELPGLAVAFLAYLTLGFCSAKFQQLQTVWLACFWIIAFLSCAVLLLAFPFAYVLRRHPSPALIATCLTLSLLFGIASGYAETLTDADQSIQRWSGFDSWWYGLLSSPGGAGDWVVNRLLLNGADWQGGELWAHRHAVAFWNGLFWLATSLAAALPIYVVTDHQHRQTALRNSPLGSFKSL